MTISGANYREGVAFDPNGAMYVTLSGGTDVAVADGGTGASTAQGAAKNLSVPYIFSVSGVPVYIAASGSMGNNGALTLGTAMGRIVSGGCWMYFPAGAVAAGVPAAPAFLWTVMSSTTAGTVYNSTYTVGSAPTVGTTTAFVTTGPGAYTGVTGAITVVSLSLPANSLGTRGGFEVDWSWGYTNSAGTKTGAFAWGGTTWDSVTPTTTVSNRRVQSVYNAGATGFQIAGPDGVNAIFGATTTPNKVGIADTTASTTFTFTMNKNTATDNAGLEYHRISVLYVA